MEILTILAISYYHMEKLTGQKYNEIILFRKAILHKQCNTQKHGGRKNEMEWHENCFLLILWEHVFEEEFVSLLPLSVLFVFYYIQGIMRYILSTFCPKDVLK